MWGKHSGECKFVDATCYKCGVKGHTVRVFPEIECHNYGVKGHRVRYCPKLAGKGKGAGSLKAKARAYTVTKKEAKRNADVVSGTFLINNIPAYVLFDSDATLSFFMSFRLYLLGLRNC
jgi:hypothetical protein